MLYLDYLVHHSSPGCVDSDFIPFHFTDEATGNGRVNRQFPLFDIRLVITDHLEGLLLIFIHIIQINGDTKDHLTTVVDLGDVDDLGIAQLTFYLHDSAFNKPLLLSGSVVFRVFLKIAVLTGLYPPTKGDCYVLGYSISKARSVVYRLLGICPQHDVLWHSLTVQEHLNLYATLKGVPASERANAVRSMMSDVGIPEKAHTRSHALSGGMKRKLSVGCALIGGSRAVLLDEPSSGMDPSSRRSMWELLRRAKPHRVLVLTTHYMDEVHA